MTRKALLLAACVLAVVSLSCSGEASSDDKKPTQGSSEAAPVSSRLSEFYPSGQFQVSLAGQPSEEARLYHSENPPAWLMTAPDFSAPALLHPGGRVEKIDPQDLVAGEDGMMKLRSGYRTSPAGSLSVTDELVRFQFESIPVELRSKPDLLKAHTSSEIKDYDPAYSWRASRYVPDTALVQTIAASVGQPVRLEVFFGSWCQYCKRYVPHLMSLEEALQGSAVEFSYYGLPHDFSQEPLATAKGIQRVPTVIVSSGDREIGRLIGHDCEKPEIKLAQVVAR